MTTPYLTDTGVKVLNRILDAPSSAEMHYNAMVGLAFAADRASYGDYAGAAFHSWCMYGAVEARMIETRDLAVARSAVFAERAAS